ncbi:unnamed protein product [Polarella glacialis]|uniref:FAS1 domain-containing protein n=2 Tax=Polarella glacialis TaxID=89957 RepID=A0A813KD50_POLGL|nr:unnamed protein product [Polarella glacialis]
MATSSSMRSRLTTSWSAPGLTRSFAYKMRAMKSVQHMYDGKQTWNRDVQEATPEALIQSQMYTPEVLRSDNLTRNCHRLVVYGLNMPELLDRYAARAEELAAQLTPSQFSVILNSFARASHRHDKMLKTFSKRMIPRLPQFLPMDICQTCNAFAKLREHDEPLFRRLGTEMPHKLPLFEGFQLGKVANAFARLDVRDDLLFDDIADEIIRRPQELNHVDLLLVANAFGHFRMRHERLWPVLAEWLVQSHLDLEAQDIATVLNALSAVDFKHEELLQALLFSIAEEPLLSELKPASLGLALNALARLRWPPPNTEADTMLEALAKRAVALLGKFDSASITQLLHASALLRPLADNTDLMEGILERSRKLVPEFSAQSLSILVHSCARLQRRDVPLLTQVAKTATPKIKEFNPQALALMAHGFAKLEVRSEILFYLLAGDMVEKMPLFSGQGICMVLKAYAKLQINNQKLVQACKKHVRALADELTLQEIDAIEAGLRDLATVLIIMQQLWLFNPRLEASSCWQIAPPAAFRGSALASAATGVLPPSAVADASAPSSVNLVGLTAVGATLAAAASTSRRGQKVAEKSGRTAVVARRAETIAATAIANGNFTILVKALQKAGLVATVSGKSPYTVFAPIDAAFADLLKELGCSAEQLLANPDLKSILLYHVVGGSTMSSSLKDGQKVTTAQSGQLAVQIAGGKVKVGRATVTAADIECSNGVIHVIDKASIQSFFSATQSKEVMGSSGAFILLLQHFMAVTSTGSAEIIAVSSILTYDIYYTYLNPELAGCSACNGVIHVIDKVLRPPFFSSHVHTTVIFLMPIIFSFTFYASPGDSIGLYGSPSKASIQSFFSATQSKEDFGAGGYFSSLGSYIQNDGAFLSKVMGSSGAFILLLQLFMTVTSTGSAEIIAVSSILTYDIYYTYLNPELKGRPTATFFSSYVHTTVIFLMPIIFSFTVYASPGDSIGLYGSPSKASIQSFFPATQSKEDLGTGGYFSSLGSYIQNDGACYSSSTTALEKSCSFKKLAKDEWCCSSDVAVTGDGHHCRAPTKDCIDVSESQHFESSECDFGAGERCVTSFLTMGSPSGLLFGIANIVGNFGTVFVDQSYWQSAVAANPKSAVKGFLIGGLVGFAAPFCMATTTGLAGRALTMHPELWPAYISAAASGAGLRQPGSCRRSWVPEALSSCCCSFSWPSHLRAAQRSSPFPPS